MSASRPSTLTRCVFTCGSRSPSSRSWSAINSSGRPAQSHRAVRDAWTQPGKIVVSGAFTIARWRPYDAIVVTRNPQYWDAASVKLDSLTFFAVEDLTTMMNLYKAGEVYATFNHTVPSSWIPLVKQYRTTWTPRKWRPSPTSFNTTKGPTADVRVRHAPNMSVDKNAWRVSAGRQADDVDGAGEHVSRLRVAQGDRSIPRRRRLCCRGWLP